MCLAACSHAVPQEDTLVARCRPASVQQRETDIKIAALDAIPAIAPTAHLTVNEFPLSGALPGGRVAVALPASADSFRVLDNAMSRITVVSRKDGKTETLPLAASLDTPIMMREAKGDLYIWDAEGLKVFRTDGTLVRVVRSHTSVNDFVVLPDGNVAVNPMTRGRSPALFWVLDSAGRRIGEGTAEAPNSPLSEMAYLASCAKELVVATTYEPVLRFFSQAGQLLRHTHSRSHRMHP